MCPEVRLSLWKWVPRISPTIKAAGAYGWRPTTLVVPNIKKIRGLNLPGTPWATWAFCGKTFTFTFMFIIYVYINRWRICTTIQENIFSEPRPCEIRFLIFSLLKIKENPPSAHFEFPCWYCRRPISGSLLSSTTSEWGCLPQYPSELPYITVAICGSAVWDLFMVHVWWCSKKFWSTVFPEQWIGRGGPTAWSARSLDLNRLHFFLSKTSEVWSLCCRSPWNPGLATTNAE